MRTYFIQKFNKSITFFFILGKYNFLGHVKNFQIIDWKNLIFDPKKVRHPLTSIHSQDKAESLKIINCDLFFIYTIVKIFIIIKLKI